MTFGIVAVASACNSSDRAPWLDDSAGTGGRSTGRPAGGSGNAEDDAGAAGSGGRGSAGRDGGAGEGGDDGTGSGGGGGTPQVDAGLPAGITAQSVGDGLFFSVVRIDSDGDVVITGTTYKGAYEAVGETFEGNAAGVFVGKYRGADFSPVYQKVFRPVNDAAGDGSLLLLGAALGANDELYLHAGLAPGEAADFGGGPIQGRDFVVTLTEAAEFVQVKNFEGFSGAYDMRVDSDGALLFAISEDLAFNRNGLELPPVPFDENGLLSGSAGAAKYTSDALGGIWVKRLAKPRSMTTHVAKPDGTGRIVLVGGDGTTAQGGGMFVAALDGASGDILLEKEFAIDSTNFDSNAIARDVARAGDAYVVTGNTSGKLAIDGTVVLPQDAERPIAFVGSFSSTDGALRWVRTVEGPDPANHPTAATRAAGLRVVALKDSTSAVLFAKTMIADADPSDCQWSTASIRHYDASGSVLGEKTLVDTPFARVCRSSVFVDEMVAAPDGTLVLYGRNDGIPFLPAGRFLMRVEM